MAASVRIAEVRGATYPGNSVGTGRSVGSLSVARVRLAEVAAQTSSTFAQVRVSDVTAYTGSAALAQVRFADVTAEAVIATYVWDGTQWVPIGPAGVGLSQGTGASTGSLGTAPSLTAASVGNGRSTASIGPTYAGSITVTGTGVVTVSGSANPTPPGGVGTINVVGTGIVTITGTASQGPPGAGSLTVTADPTNNPPRMRLSLAGALGTTVTVLRIDQAGNKAPVRLANPATLNAGGWVGFDYEAPFGEPVTYRATTSAPAPIVSDPVTLAVTQPWLLHPGIPALSVPLTVVSRGDRTRSTNQGVHYVLGRRDPIVITDGVRRSPVYELVVRTGIDADDTAACTEDDLDALLGDASTLLLQITYGNRRSVYDWVSIGDVSDSDMVESWFDGDYRHWTLPCTVASAPSGLLQSQRTWASLLAEEATWAAVVNDFATWRDEINDTVSG